MQVSVDPIVLLATQKTLSRSQYMFKTPLLEDLHNWRPNASKYWIYIQSKHISVDILAEFDGAFRKCLSWSWLKIWQTETKILWMACTAMYCCILSETLPLLPLLPLFPPLLASSFLSEVSTSRIPPTSMDRKNLKTELFFNANHSATSSLNRSHRCAVLQRLPEAELAPKLLSRAKWAHPVLVPSSKRTSGLRPWNVQCNFWSLVSLRATPPVYGRLPGKPVGHALASMLHWASSLSGASTSVDILMFIYFLTFSRRDQDFYLCGLGNSLNSFNPWLFKFKCNVYWNF